MALRARYRRAVVLVGTSALSVIVLGLVLGAVFAPGVVTGEPRETIPANQHGYVGGLAWEKAQLAVTAPPPPAPPVNPPPPPPNKAAVSAAVAFARAQLGEPYELGSMGPDKWDCSGLTKASYASIGVNIGNHSATAQFNTLASAGRLVPLADLEVGDLLWFSVGGAVGVDKYHTAIYIGGGRMIEAARPGTTVRIVPLRYGDLVPYAGRPTP